MIITQKTILELLNDACRAPSGDNIQPWRFRFGAGELTIYNVPGIHNPHLDFEERGSYIAHGALLESLGIAAPHYGYAASFTLFPDSADTDAVARMTFTPCERYDDPLYPSIQARVTNRHRYAARPLSRHQYRALAGAASDISGVEVRCTESPDDITRLGYAASRAEIVILEDEGIAAHFFSGMVWTREEESDKKCGFWIQTLEFNPIQKFVFWLASKPSIMRVLRVLGVPRFVAHEDAKLYATASLSGGVVVPDASREAYIAAGRALMRVWLTATREELGLQPLIGMTFIAHKSAHGLNTLVESHVREMREAVASARRVLGVEAGNLALLFRIGFAPAPSARTSRKDPVIVFE